LAYRNALRYQGASVQRLAGLGESIVYGGNGIVTEDARKAFSQILQLEPGRPEPRFWLALGQEQDGKIIEAIAAYRALLAGGPPDARWRPVVEERLKKIDPGFKPSAPQAKIPSVVARGPTADDVKAAQTMAPKDQQAMIAGMVDGLAERLKKDPKDINGWIMLTRAYMVLGRKDDATSAIDTARKTFAGDAATLARLNEHAKNLGLGS
jgi:cytochrome c-type biogenesis protein CcmH